MQRLVRLFLGSPPPHTAKQLFTQLVQNQKQQLPHLPAAASSTTITVNHHHHHENAQGNNLSTRMSTYEDEYSFIKSHSAQNPSSASLLQFQKQWRKQDKYFEKTASDMIQWTVGQLDEVRDSLAHSNSKLKNNGHGSLYQNMAIYPDHCYYFSIYDPELVIVRLRIECMHQDNIFDDEAVIRNEVTRENGEEDDLETKIWSAYKALSMKQQRQKNQSDMDTYNNIELDYGNDRVKMSVQVVFDKNRLINQLKTRWIAGGKKDHVTMPSDAVSISPDQTLLAYKYKFGANRLIEIVHIPTQQVIDRIAMPQIISGMEFSTDSSRIYYTVENDNHRPYRVMSHKLITMSETLKNNEKDEILLDEPDESFYLELYRTKDHQCLFINSGNRATSECFIINESENKVNLLKQRKTGELFFPEHHNGSIYAVTNCDNATNLQLVKLEINSSPSNIEYSVIIPARNDIRIDDIEVFDNYLLLYEKKFGLDQIRVIHMNQQYDNYVVNVPECSNIHHLINRRFSSKLLFINLDSIVHHEKLHLLNLEDKSLKPIEPETPNSPSNNFVVNQVKVKSTNSSVEIPLVIAHHKNIKLGGNNPCLIIAYGAYGHATDLSFEMQKLFLLHNNFVIAFPQVRGGGDGDINWHKDGSLLNKKNSFSDFNDCVRYLVKNKYTNPSLVCAKGVSAGGMLVATSSLCHPEFYRSIVLKVPFLDVTTTMLDKSLPLTELESDEWGDPTQSKAYFDYIQSYSPYELLRTVSEVNKLPHMYISVAMKDFHVPSWQVFKYVARLTRRMREQQAETPLIACKILDDAEHGDDAGKNGTHENIASEYAFIFASLGIQPEPWPYNNLES